MYFLDMIFVQLQLFVLQVSVALSLQTMLGLVGIV